jgi:hypothetical protein
LRERLLPAETMNISHLKSILESLPDDITSVQFAEIELEIEDLLAQQRQADEAELAATLERAKALQVKLGVSRAPVVIPPPRPTGDTDFDNGVDYAESEGQSFAAEVAAIRQHNVERRRNRGQH